MRGQVRGGYGEHTCAIGWEGVACGLQGTETSEGHKMDGELKKNEDPAKKRG